MAAAAARPEPYETAAPGTAVAVVEKNKVMRFLDSPEAKSRIAPMLGNNGRYDQVKVEVWCAIQMNPEIAQCTPASQVHAIAAAVGTGLIIGKGVHLVPFNTKISKRGEPDAWEKRLQAILDYKGKVELIVRTGTARALYAKCVYANEIFEYEEGLEQKLRHVPITDPKKRGALRGAYAIARLSFSNVLTMFVPIEEIEAIRKNSKQWSPNRVAECPYWYAEKTVLHRISKSLPATPRLALALRDLRTDDDEELGYTEPYPEQLPPVAASTPSIERALPPRGTQLGANGYDEIPPRTDDVPVRVSDHGPVDPALLAAHMNIEDPYGEPPASPQRPVVDDDAEFDFEEDDTPLPHEMGQDERDDARREPKAVACPKCGGPMWDNRDSKTKPNQPDFKCKNAPKARGEPGCPGVIWPPRD